METRRARLTRDTPPSEFNMTELGNRIRLERASRQLDLEELSAQSGVSRSMLSAVERGQKVPTVLVLDRIATGLGTSIARLLGDEIRSPVVVINHRDQDVVRERKGWERRILSPVLPGIEFEFMRTTIKPGVDAGIFNPHGPGSREYVAVERGVLLLTIDDTPYRLEAGDSIYYDGDCRHGFSNPGRINCVYYLVMDVGARSGLAHRYSPAKRNGRSSKQR